LTQSIRFFINYMIKGIGVDVIEIDRIKKIGKNQRFLDQILTEKEKSLLSHPDVKDNQVAIFFALKEAALKALGIGLYYGYYWRFIDTSESSNLKLTGYLKEHADKNDIQKMTSTFAHTKKHVVAFVVLEG